MSRSPRDENDPDQIFQYRKAWAAINTMLERGRSLSGRERHCAFLNTGGTRFADVSAASSLDLLDDGRGVALVDWDYDGQMDIWTTNRTGPWVRLLNNQSKIGHHFLSVKLEGVRCNRDAVGARMELHLGGSNPRTLYKSVRAGEGFVAQSSKRVLFGLGTAKEIDKLVVHWPDGDVQTVAGLACDSHYEIRQGNSRPRLWSPPSPAQLPQFALSPDPDATARIALAGRVPLPALEYEDFRSRRVELATDSGRPTLVNLWASWCAPCMSELEEWKKHWPEHREQIDILALNVELLDEENGAAADNIASVVRNRKFPFTTGLATQASIETLEAVVSALVDKPQSLVTPMSVLIDKDGRVAVIYRGAVSVERVMRDADQLDGTILERRDRAAHFPGRWFDAPPASDPSVLLRNFVAAGRMEAAEAYLQRWNEHNDQRAPPAEAYYVVADAYRAAGQWEAAVATFHRALAIDPSQPRINLDIANSLIKLGKIEEAVPHLETSLAGDPNNTDTRKRLVAALARVGRVADMQAHAALLVEHDPQDAIARLHLAHALKKQQQFSEALVQYRLAARQRPDLLIAQNDLAWLLATCPDDDVRDGGAALAIAQQMCQATNHRNPALLDTLAAAQAENGQFAQAVTTLKTAMRLANDADDERLGTIIRQHVNLFEREMPLRED